MIAQATVELGYHTGEGNDSPIATSGPGMTVVEHIRDGTSMTEISALSNGVRSLAKDLNGIFHILDIVCNVAERTRHHLDLRGGAVAVMSIHITICKVKVILNGCSGASSQLSKKQIELPVQLSTAVCFKSNTHNAYSWVVLDAVQRCGKRSKA